jgi:hypothetical protein
MLDNTGVEVHVEEEEADAEVTARQVLVQRNSRGRQLRRRRLEEAPLGSCGPRLGILAPTRRGDLQESVQGLGSAGDGSTVRRACTEVRAADGVGAEICRGSRAGGATQRVLEVAAGHGGRREGTRVCNWGSGFFYIAGSRGNSPPAPESRTLRARSYRGGGRE